MTACSDVLRLLCDFCFLFSFSLDVVPHWIILRPLMCVCRVERAVEDRMKPKQKRPAAIDSLPIPVDDGGDVPGSTSKRVRIEKAAEKPTAAVPAPAPTISTSSQARRRVSGDRKRRVFDLLSAVYELPYDVLTLITSYGKLICR